MTLQRCLSIFLQALGSDVTKENYLYQLDRFLAWNKLKNYDDLLKADEKSIQRNLEDYLIYLKDKYSPNYVPSIIAPVELFYTMNEINLNSKRLHKLFPTRIKKGGYGSYTREHIGTMLDNTNKKRTKALILFLASSGCRVGVIPELKLKHVTNIENCKQILCYAESKEEYITFMSPEASKAFDDYLEERIQDQEKLKPDSPAFRKSYILGSLPAETMLQGTVRNALTITLKDVAKTKTGTRFNIPTLHGLRKFFNVSLKSRHDCNLSLCEKLMGHSTTIPLDNHYGTFSPESIFAEYKKAIPELSISQEYKLNEELQQSRQEIDITKDKLIEELKSNKRELDDFKARFDSMEKLLLQITR